MLMRRNVVDETALVKALKEKQIYGAALDVFHHEVGISVVSVDDPYADKNLLDVACDDREVRRTFRSRQCRFRAAHVSHLKNNCPIWLETYAAFFNRGATTVEVTRDSTVKAVEVCAAFLNGQHVEVSE